MRRGAPSQWQQRAAVSWLDSSSRISTLFLSIIDRRFHPVYSANTSASFSLSLASPQILEHRESHHVWPQSRIPSLLFQNKAQNQDINDGPSINYGDGWPPFLARLVNNLAKS